jgi:endonuclease/exonuclease/phosphatase family metal-dependent hydrolase
MGLIVAGLAAGDVHAQLRIATYNVLNNPDNASEDSQMRSVFQGIANQTVNGIAKPLDIVSFQEIDNAGLNRIPGIFEQLRPSGDYRTISTASVGGDRNAILYDAKRVTLLGTQFISTDGPRDTIRARFIPVGYSSPDAEFYVYASHLKAGQSSGGTRNAEMQTIRNNADTLSADRHVIYAGDFNLYGTGDSAYRTMTTTGTNRGQDPLPLGYSVPGSNNVTYPSSGRRFDYQFVTNDFTDGEGLALIDDSYRVFYGSGDSISDHRPVVADYQLPAVMDAAVTLTRSTFELGESAEAVLSIENIAPVITALGADELDYAVTVSGDLMGAFQGSLLATAGPTDHLLTLDTATLGQKLAQIWIASTSEVAENASIALDVEFVVVPEPSLLVALSPALVLCLIRKQRHHLGDSSA